MSRIPTRAGSSGGASIRDPRQPLRASGPTGSSCRSSPPTIESRSSGPATRPPFIGT
jgi:hypothetical protein